VLAVVAMALFGFKQPASARPRQQGAT
jgi:hypothetical protein